MHPALQLGVPVKVDIFGRHFIPQSLHDVGSKLLNDRNCVAVVLRLKALPISCFCGANEIELWAKAIFPFRLPRAHGAGSRIRDNFLDPRPTDVRSQDFG
jgi:hypothetical protein